MTNGPLIRAEAPEDAGRLLLDERRDAAVRHPASPWYGRMRHDRTGISVPRSGDAPGSERDAT
jgi:hypothetical protein